MHQHAPGDGLVFQITLIRCYIHVTNAKQSKPPAPLLGFPNDLESFFVKAWCDPDLDEEPARASLFTKAVVGLHDSRREVMINFKIAGEDSAHSRVGITEISFAISFDGIKIRTRTTGVGMLDEYTTRSPQCRTGFQPVYLLVCMNLFIPPPRIVAILVQFFLQRVVGYVIDLVLKLFIVSNNPIKRFMLPDRSGSTSAFIDQLGRVPLDRMQHFTKRDPLAGLQLKRCQEQMYVIAHDHHCV